MLIVELIFIEVLVFLLIPFQIAGLLDLIIIDINDFILIEVEVIDYFVGILGRLFMMIVFIQILLIMADDVLVSIAINVLIVMFKVDIAKDIFIPLESVGLIMIVLFINIFSNFVLFRFVALELFIYLHYLVINTLLVLLFSIW